MRTQYIDQIVNEILTDMSHRNKNAADPSDLSSVPNFEDAFGKLIEPSPRQTAGNPHRKDENQLIVRSLTPPQATGNALAVAVQDDDETSKDVMHRIWTELKRKHR